ncbi:hypothetical protein HanHA300_Chr17g0663831 [Helianthus annuus]|nr:hypothetical protein HanHA300_Chr17g0663831 [Helianthus annuus]KAJ0434715.1 hypothetical protein HanIR_Chr17g0884861 [Helianthus annuus]KAJ0448430.1 hypothetical protein HanHA89_Chr17g0716771 [Helianthus annuus]KAJ0633316.1 hypothetical protein HanLR1_Chr17g0675291 [Helianthus annuus]
MWGIKKSISELHKKIRKWLKSQDNVRVVDGSWFENRSSRLKSKSKQPSRFCSLRLLQYSSNAI